MKATHFIHLLSHPDTINEKKTIDLETVLYNYPYLQSARALHLKGLYNSNGFRYNYELKKAAAYTQDRDILFNFITSENFTVLQNKKIVEEFLIEDTTVTFEPVNTEEKIKKEDDKKVEISETSQLNLTSPSPLEDTNEQEKHSFNEWLQLTKLKPINREKKEEKQYLTTDKNKENEQKNKEKKLNLIDNFIKNNPKISPIKEDVKIAENTSKTSSEPTFLMTETLAKIYLEQKKYQRAIQSYEILILKYPEKSSFFANQIEKIKQLQK